MDIDSIIDINELKDRLEGDMELLHELADIFISDSVNLINNLTKAISEKDPQLISKTAHTIKGAVANFSARKAYEIAYSIEKTAKEGNISGITETFESLKKEIENLRNALIQLKERSEF